MWIAIAATALTFATLQFLVGVAGLSFAAGPGLLPWWFFIRHLRRRKVPVTIGASEAKAVVFDGSRRLLAVQGAPRIGAVRLPDGWIGAEVRAPSEEMLGAIRDFGGASFREGSVQRTIGGTGVIVGVGLVLIFFCVVMAAIAIPSFISFTRKAKTAEASENVLQIFRGVATYYSTERMGPGFTVAGPELPPSLPRTPPTPPCGRQPWPPNADPRWRELLDFEPFDPVLFAYEYQRSPDGQSFVVRAVGDLDCDGQQSLFEIVGRVEGGEVVRDTAMRIVDETE